jgi:hypothetical protein
MSELNMKLLLLFLCPAVIAYRFYPFTLHSSRNPNTPQRDPQKASKPISPPHNIKAHLGTYFKFFHYPFNRASAALQSGSSSSSSLPNSTNFLAAGDGYGSSTVVVIRLGSSVVVVARLGSSWQNSGWVVGVVRAVWWMGLQSLTVDGGQR